MFIERGVAREIKNSRGEKTIEVSIKTSNGTFVASAPSGKSKGANEVPDYNDKGLIWSVRLANRFLASIKNKNVFMNSIQEISDLEEQIKDFEKDYGKLGGNTVYAIETAILKAVAKDNFKPLWRFIRDSYNSNEIKMPMPVGNCIGGGLHSKGINGVKPDFQEFLLIATEDTVSKAITKNIHAYFSAKKILRKKNRQFLVKRNDENAWNTNLTNEDTLQVLKEVADKFKLKIGLDVASSSFSDQRGYYKYKNKSLMRDRLEQIKYMKDLIEKYNLFYVEDPLNEEDFSGFSELVSKINRKNTLIVGDDLTTTNFRRVERAVRVCSINAMIVKPNQIGSIAEVMKVMEFCKKNKIKTIFSHRSGETMDDALADYAVGFQADYVKTGIYGKERLIKLRRLIQIEKEILSRHKK